MIGVRGYQYPIDKDKYKNTALHYVFINRTSTEVIMKMVELGSYELIMEKILLNAMHCMMRFHIAL